MFHNKYIFLCFLQTLSRKQVKISAKEGRIHQNISSRSRIIHNRVWLKRFITLLLNIMTFFFIFNALKMLQTLLIPTAIPSQMFPGSSVGLHFYLFFPSPLFIDGNVPLVAPPPLPPLSALISF